LLAACFAKTHSEKMFFSKQGQNPKSSEGGVSRPAILGVRNDAAQHGVASSDIRQRKHVASQQIHPFALARMPGDGNNNAVARTFRKPFHHKHSNLQKTLHTLIQRIEPIPFANKI
jgi:hypothetical protein